MPSYWENKALPTPSRYFIFNFLIISFIFIKINAFPMRYEIWKGGKKVQQKAGLNSVLIVSKRLRDAIYLRLWSCCLTAVFCSVDYPSHTMVSGVSVNRHSVIFNSVIGQGSFSNFRNLKNLIQNFPSFFDFVSFFLSTFYQIFIYLYSILFQLYFSRCLLKSVFYREKDPNNLNLYNLFLRGNFGRIIWEQVHI